MKLFGCEYLNLKKIILTAVIKMLGPFGSAVSLVRLIQTSQYVRKETTIRSEQ